MKICIQSAQHDIEYDILISRNIINELEKYIKNDKKYLIITDNGVPETYIKKVKDSLSNSLVFTINAGEESKNLNNAEQIIDFMIKNKFTRSDCIIAVGGGVIGDLSGFVSSIYMRGINYYIIPTTLLSQVDSSVGGKTAVDFNSVKNAVGSFCFPQCVLIDPLTLNTLDKRQFSSGLAEAIKMALSCDSKLFETIENSHDIYKDIDKIIENSIKIKADIVRKDPFEKELRMVLNFGHTIGHAVESLSLGKLLHGECVAIGMTYMCSEKVKKRLIPILDKYSLPKNTSLDKDKIIDLIKSDKKARGNEINIVYVEDIGSFEFRKIKIDNLREML